MFDRIKKSFRNRQTQNAPKPPRSSQEHMKKQANKAQAMKQNTPPPLTFPVTNLMVQRSGTRLFKAASLTMCGFAPDNESQNTFQPRLGGRNDFLFSILDGHNGATASTSLKGLVESKFAGLKMTNENITKAFLWFDQQYNGKTMFRDGTTCTMVYGQPWNALTDERVVNLERFLQAYDPGVEQLLRDQADPISPAAATSASDNNRIRVIDPQAGFPDDFVLRLLSINIGNSKAMLIRPNGNWIAITEDHTPNNRKERNRILKAGGVIIEGKINGRHPVTRSIGDKLYKKLEGVPLLDQMIVPLPDFEEHIMLPGDLLLISCNGLFQGKNMDFSTIAGLVADSVKARGKEFDPAGVLRDLFEVSLEQGSRDNHSATLLHFSNGLKFVQAPLLETELIPGPLPKMHGIDKESATAPRFRYVKSYVADLMRNGYTLDDVYDYHKVHRDFDMINGHDMIRPIIYKGDIGKQIQQEEEERIALEMGLADDQDSQESYVTHDSKFQYEHSGDQGNDPRHVYAQNRATLDPPPQPVLPKAGQYEPWMDGLQYKFKPDEGSRDNKGQRKEFDFSFGNALPGLASHADSGSRDGLSAINPNSGTLNLDSTPNPAPRSFFGQLRDTFGGGSKRM